MSRPARSVDVILNPNARRLGPGSPLRAALIDAATRAGAQGVHETPTLEALATAARVIAERGTDAVVLAGGDGSTMAGVSALARAFGRSGHALPSVAIAPGGTVGTVARALGLRGSARALAREVVRAAFAPAPLVVRVATLHVEDDAGGDRVGFIFGAGLVARFFEVYEAAPRPGLVAAAGIVSRVFAGSFVGSAFARSILDPVPCRVTVDGAPVRGDAWSLIVASVVRDVGLHLLVTYRAGEETERFHAVASGLPPAALGPQMPRVLVGKPLRGEPRVDALVRALGLTFDGPGAYVLDGDLIRAPSPLGLRVVRVQAGPVLSVIVPDRAGPGAASSRP